MSNFYMLSTMELCIRAPPRQLRAWSTASSSVSLLGMLAAGYGAVVASRIS